MNLSIKPFDVSLGLSIYCIQSIRIKSYIFISTVQEDKYCLYTSYAQGSKLYIRTPASRNYENQAK